MCTTQIGRARPIDSCQTRSVPVYQIQIMSVLVAMRDKYTARPNRFDPMMKEQPISSNVAIAATSGAKSKRGCVTGESTLPKPFSTYFTLGSTMFDKSRNSLSLLVRCGAKPVRFVKSLSIESYMYLKLIARSD